MTVTSHRIGRHSELLRLRNKKQEKRWKKTGALVYMAYRSDVCFSFFELFIGVLHTQDLVAFVFLTHLLQLSME